MLSTTIVILVLSVSVAALGLLAAYQQHQLQRLRSLVSQLIQNYQTDSEKSDET
ncbi:hypothetical protein [Roseiconus lacunae]|uniref:Uncharacterized protein n=1 Tax=Roseiconus lacunae TaxID=2605694 RepID=A0ABT7PNS1_9BACT|nr:hypothetical protein [Roseiconus lacunae]MDM4018164.1 hypothetical protein [Roseiconus lacunae]